MPKHLTLRERVKLQYIIESQHNMTLSKMAEILKVNRSSIFRELKNRTIKKPGKAVSFNKQNGISCGKLTRFPFCCNGCERRTICSKPTADYDAYLAQETYRKSLHESRKHPQRSKQELKRIDDLVSPKVINGQSLYHILVSDESINCPESTLRRYIDSGWLQARNIDLPRTIRYRKMPNTYRPRSKPLPVVILNGRTYQDYQDYCVSSNRISLQLDTVIGKLRDNHFILTLYEPQSRFQWAYILPRSAMAVNNKIRKLMLKLSENHILFFDSLLCDNGFEFQLLPQVEMDAETGEIYCRVFYCDPYSSYQKGGCERNHEFFRFFYKKGKTLDFITQDEINEIFSHINSLRRKSLDGDSSFKRFMKLFKFDPTSFLGVTEIVSDKLHMKK